MSQIELKLINSKHFRKNDEQLRVKNSLGSAKLG